MERRMMSSTTLIPAAQYLRMSTEEQQFSIQNQSAKIREYAAQHSFGIIQTYVDAGRSGVVLKSRAGLRKLLQDVVSGTAGYKAILVYDISRWGRFQDTDEAAHYEFLCTSSGIPVHYCAEPFANDGTLPSSILKALKRTMAGEYSRELGVKVFEGKRRIVQLGFRVGGQSGYGLRRMMISADRDRKRRLEKGEYKSLTADRVILVLGPKREVEIVRDIYFMVLKKRIGPTAIARELNRRGIGFLDGRPWNPLAVRRLLTNPKYTGCNTWGRTTQRLRSPILRVPSQSWVTRPGAFAAVIDQRVFDRVQVILHDRQVKKPNEWFLKKLRRLLANRGHLAAPMVDSARGMPKTATYHKRFGSLRRAYELVGYHPRPQRLKIADHCMQTILLREALMSELVSLFSQTLTVLRVNQRKRPLVLLRNGLKVSIVLCRAQRTRTGLLRWLLRAIPAEREYVTLLCNVNLQDDGFDSWYLLPGIGSEVGKFRFLGENDPWLQRGKRLLRLSEFYDAATQLAQQVRQ